MHSYIFNSRDKFHKNPFGAVKTGQKVTFTLKMPKLYDPHVELILYEDEGFTVCPAQLESWSDEYDYRVCRFTPEKAGLYFYCFEADIDGGRHRITKGENSCATLDGQEMWQLTVYDKNFKTPEFIKGGLLYQIFPDRFCKSNEPKELVHADRVLHSDWYELPKYTADSDGEYRPNDYFGGDLKGITSKLDYLFSIGITAIYLNPIFEAHSNHRYNTADYMKIDPMLGSETDFNELCSKASKYGISVILDGVFSHTGSDSVYFNKEQRYGDGGAYNDTQSPYRRWYRIGEDNSYDSWWGFKSLPNLIETEPSYMGFICGENGVLRHWQEHGAKGWRLDVADELPDQFIDKLCSSAKAYDSQAIVIGEVWEDASNKTSYGDRRRYLLGRQLDSVMNYPFRNAIISLVRDLNAEKALDIIMTILENYPKCVVDCLMNMLSTHDVARIITMLGGMPSAGRDRMWQGENNTLTHEQYNIGKLRFILASVMQYTLPGVPSIYYGDEAGLYGYSDPFNRTCYPWGKEDTGLISHFRLLGQIRKNPVFAQGDFIPVNFAGGFACYQRRCGENAAFIIVNAGEKEINLKLPAKYSTVPVLMCGKLSDGKAYPYSAGIYFTKPNKA